MVRAYLDEDVSVLLAPLLQAREINASTARDHAMLGKQDEEQLRKAIELNAILITHNRVDFEIAYADYTKRGITHQGIIVLARKRDIYTIARRIAKFLSQHPSLENQLWYL